ncbi:MAG: hypothetical protein O9301_06255 [Leptospira sp.]|nr:hypothetical protein [Leptospira sp.]
MKPNQKETLSEDFFTKKLQLEDQLLVFEELQKKATEHLVKIEELASEMLKIADDNKSAYFLQRTKRLLAEIHKINLKKGYNQREFDPLYHILSKIKSEDRIEFLNTALVNRISMIAKSLNVDPVPNAGVVLNSNKKIFLSYILDGVHFLLPKYKYKLLHNIPAFKNRIKIKDKVIPLFPGKGFTIEQTTSEKNLILLSKSPKNVKGFYYDTLGEDWAISESSFNSILVKENVNKQILGKIRKKGDLYHVIKI